MVGVFQKPSSGGKKMSNYRRLFLALGCASWFVAAGCSDSPTAQRTEETKSLVEVIGAMGPRTDMIENTIPGPYPISITNSNGTPLISWSALSGATSYTVSLIYLQIQDDINWIVDGYWVSELTTTTSTSYLDTGNVYTGESYCSLWYYQGPFTFFVYAVQATFPHGTSDIFYYPVEAPIAQCF
jgi:hypothetical protein